MLFVGIPTLALKPAFHRASSGSSRSSFLPHFLFGFNALRHPLKGQFPILVLGPPFGRHDRDVGWFMYQPNPGVSLVPVLPARPTIADELDRTGILQ